MRPVYIAGACRTPVAPANGVFASIEAWELAAACIRPLVDMAERDGQSIDGILLGNVLYGGGNPARMASLEAGLDESVWAVSLDSQCCGGLDAIALGAARIAAGEADIVLAGGTESFSRAPIRMRKPSVPAAKAETYSRPPFAPWPDRDPDLVEAAAELASARGISREAQEAFAIESHRKTRNAVPDAGEMVPLAGHSHDLFARNLKAETCARLPALAGSAPFELTAATIAVEADAAACVLLASETAMERMPGAALCLRYVRSMLRGGAPEQPSLVPVEAARQLLDQHALAPSQLVAAEIMEAFAVQAMVFTQDIGLDDQIVNRGGGALARGHPVGASGAILAVRLAHDMSRSPAKGFGLAAIAAAGGLGSAMLLAN